MLRIIAGERRGSKLATMPGNETRPLRDRVRESLFSIVQTEIPDARVLDIFAGSGAVGLEALSRGAAHTTFVEASPPALRIIRENVAKLRYEEKTTLVGRKIPGALTNVESDRSLIFVMPPYAGTGLDFAALSEIHRLGIAAKEALAVVEVRSSGVWPGETAIEPWRIVDDRTYGVTRLVFLRYSPES